MDKLGSVVVVGGSAGIGKCLARHYADRGYPVFVTSRDQGRADAAAREIGGDTTGLCLDLCRPTEIASTFAHLDNVKHVALVGVERDETKIKEYNIEKALKLVTLKLVGYTEVIHVLAPHMGTDGSVVLFGGLAKDRPYPGSTTVTTVNGGITTMVHTLAIELAPLRVNAIHPSFVGDSPYWAAKPESVLAPAIARTPLGRLVTMDEVVDATVFLFENRAVTGVNLRVDGGWMLM